MTYQEGATDPFDSSTTNLAPETPDIGGVILEAIRQHALALRVAIPCAITTIHGNQLVDLQPLLMARYKVGAAGPTKMPIITRALVAMPMGQNYAIKLPLAVGDTGLAVFCDRSLDIWASGTGGLVDPSDCRSHHLCDAVFYPGLATVSGQSTDSTSDLIIKNGKAVLRLAACGEFKLSNQGAELFAELVALTNSVASLANLLGSSTPAAAASAAQLAAQVTVLSTAFQSLQET